MNNFVQLQQLQMNEARIVNGVKIVSVDAMRAIEQEAMSNGTSEAAMVMMVGGKISEVIHDHFGARKNLFAVGLIGKGNNGADTIVALRDLALRGWSVLPVFVSKRGDDVFTRMACAIPGRALQFDDGDGNGLSSEAILRAIPSGSIVLDGVYGIGFRLPLPGTIRNLFRGLNARKDITVVALDCVSGVACRTGEVDPDALRATMTIAIHGVKTSKLNEPACSVGGQLRMIRMDLCPVPAAETAIHDEMLPADGLGLRFPVRADFSNKGTFGTVNILGGSTQYPGAPILAANASLRVGAGLVAIHAPESVRCAMAGALPDAIWFVLGVAEEIQREAFSDAIATGKRSTWLVGPGLGLHADAQTTLRAFFESINSGTEISLVIDADALNFLAANPEFLERIPANSIFTPHPGEMARLADCSVAAVQSDRLTVAREFAKRTKGIVVLKGAFTCVVGSDGDARVAPFANGALAKAGSGDVLSGTIAGLLAQRGFIAMDAALSGVRLHGMAGERFRSMHGQSVTLLAHEISGFYDMLIREVQQKDVLR